MNPLGYPIYLHFCYEQQPYSLEQKVSPNFKHRMGYKPTERSFHVQIAYTQLFFSERRKLLFLRIG